MGGNTYDSPKAALGRRLFDGMTIVSNGFSPNGNWVNRVVHSTTNGKRTVRAWGAA